MKNKTCMICKLGIEVDEQEYVGVKHYKKKDIVLSKGYYHIKCFRDRLTGGEKLRNLQSEVLGLVKGAKKLVGIKDEQEVVLT